jgi:hypothetical protein
MERMNQSIGRMKPQYYGLHADITNKRSCLVLLCAGECTGMLCAGLGPGVLPSFGQHCIFSVSRLLISALLIEVVLAFYEGAVVGLGNLSPKALNLDRRLFRFKLLRKR